MPYFLSLIILIIMVTGPVNSKESSVFGPVGAGRWYQADSGGLKVDVAGFLKSASPPELSGPIQAVIAPHAGYPYSGGCAAYGFKPLTGQKVDRVIVLAPSHHAWFRGLSIKVADYYATPLGNIPVDTHACNALLKGKLVSTVPRAHAQEHSLENLLPFLQIAAGGFKLVPIIVGNLETEDYAPLAGIINELRTAGTVLAVSSDFTHYGSNFQYTPFPLNADTRKNIEDLDKGCIRYITSGDFAGFRSYINKTNITVCGRHPIGLLLTILGKGASGTLMRYEVSGDMTGDYAQSVSYASIVFTVVNDPK